MPRIRRPDPGEAPAVARLHLACVRETYRGLMTGQTYESRLHMWTAALTDPQYAANRIAVADDAGTLVGLAMSGPAPATLYVLYVRTAHHGTGTGQALLDAVLDPDEPATLWVSDPNPRAQAFYRRNGFTPTGRTELKSGLPSLEMTRRRAPSATKRLTDG